MLESTGGRLVIVMAVAGRAVMCALRSRYSADFGSQRGVETVAVSCSMRDRSAHARAQSHAQHVLEARRALGRLRSDAHSLYP